jgi:adenosylhomocysteine nucleosidase
MAVIAVTGLHVEAEIARKAGLMTVCAGGIPAHTAAALGQAVAATRPSGLVSFGIAGGLAPGLRPGTLLLPGAVIAGDGTRWSVDAAWRARLRQRIEAAEGDVLGGDAIIVDAAAKALHHARGGAVAVDLESAMVAEAAARAGLPFVVLRAIADPAERGLPPAAALRLKPDGRPDLRAVFHSVLMEPAQIGALLRLARDTRRALRALTRAMELVGALLVAPR